jgi:predicted aldo/keto reductase-like oxidoreductase
MSTLAVFGAVALGQLDQAQADSVMQQVIEAKINHIDIAPSYGNAEARLGPWMPAHRQDFFLGCKTMERTKEGAIREFHESMGRLQIERFDLYQLHAVTSMDELDECTQSGGALEGVLEMQAQRLTRYVGITGHGMDAPRVFIEALTRYDFDSVLFPMNPVLFANQDYRTHALRLLDLCEEKDVGVMIIKSVAKEPWGDREQRFHTWYVPFEEAEIIQKNINFVLSHKLTHICTPGDYRLLDKAFTACENFEPMPAEQQSALIEEQSNLDLIF